MKPFIRMIPVFGLTVLLGLGVAGCDLGGNGEQEPIPPPEPTQPGQQPTQPGQQPTQPGQQPTQPGQQPTQPGQQPIQPGQPGESGQPATPTYPPQGEPDGAQSEQ